MSEKDGGSTGTSKVIVAIAGCGLLALVAAFCGGIFAAIAVPNYVAMQQAKRAKVPSNVDGIKTALLAYDAAFDGFVEQSTPHPRAVSDLTEAPVPWLNGSSFDTLGWAPFGDVRGTYWVEVQADGEDFVVHGLCDVDEDGDPAHYTATKSINATLITPMDTY